MHPVVLNPVDAVRRWPALRRLVVPVILLLWASSATVASAQAVSGFSAAEERAQARVFEAIDLMDAGSYDEARLLIKVALELNPDLDRAWYYLAQCDVELGKKAEATEALDVYEGRNLTEYERTQVADLRRRVSELPEEAAGEQEGAEGAAAGSADSGAAETADEVDSADVAGDDQSADSSVGADSGSSQAADGGVADSARAMTPAAKPGPGPVLLAAGGAVAGIGVGLVAGGLVMSRDIDSWDQGQGMYYAGLGMLVGGGASAVVGIPLTILGKRKTATVALSLSVAPPGGVSSVFVSGRW